MALVLHADEALLLRMLTLVSTLNLPRRMQHQGHLLARMSDNSDTSHAVATPCHRTVSMGVPHP